MEENAERKAQRELLRGVEGKVVSLIFRAHTSPQLAKLLQAPLERAAALGDLDLVERLLWAGADTGAALGAAIRYHNRLTIVWVLLQHGADVNTRSENQVTPLHSAAMRDNGAESIDLLVGAGANMEARDDRGLTPLHKAAYNLNLEAVITLLKHGADVNAVTEKNETPLFAATSEAAAPGAAEVVYALLRSGADETVADVHGMSPLRWIETMSRDDKGQFVSWDFEWMLDMMANAPADRAWRRRGYLVLCRAHPDRLRARREGSSAPTSIPPRTRGIVTNAGAEAHGCINGTTAGGASTADERPTSDWAGVAARVVGLQEEGIFRTILGFT